jgi:hypothetical protein
VRPLFSRASRRSRCSFGRRVEQLADPDSKSSGQLHEHRERDVPTGLYTLEGTGVDAEPLGELLLRPPFGPA